ncbi:26S proteasome non-ATPase regulatory subunit 5-like [Corticium candelabrum]|uniref:26S proteasome non-ATPase regulatory subunit 5-like n=1 Tax=Corticium candelabrum TaxID=121492 RepID=UPI002E26C7CC|nr:26S proteasome non-ATPase regulatory subunit 5-like [Corticium candelabrum]
MSTVSDLVGSLASSESVTGVLQDLQALIGNLSETEIRREASEIDVVPLFVHLDSDMTSLMIKKVWRSFGTKSILTKLGSKLSELISATTSRGLGKELLFCCLEDSVQTESGIDCIITAGLFDFILDSLSDEDLSCAQTGSKLLTAASLLGAGLNALFTADRVQKMNDIASCSDTVKYRVFALCVDIATSSDQGFECCVTTGIFAGLLQDLDCDDVLLQLNCIELLGKLATSQRGFAYLKDAGVLNKLTNMLAQWPLDPFLSFVTQGVIRFFGNLCLSAPQSVKTICTEHPIFLSTVLAKLQKSDGSVIGIAIDTIGMLGSTDMGRSVLQGTPNNGQDFIRSMGRIMESSESPIRIRCIEALSSLFKNIDASDSSSEITHSWYLVLHDHPMQIILSIASQPFDDIHAAGLKLLTSIASNTWGLQQIQACPGLLEYCLDRSTENTKTGKELKYRLISTMVDTDNALGVLGMPVMLQLKMYVRDGPFHTTAQSTITMESSN